MSSTDLTHAANGGGSSAPLGPPYNPEAEQSVLGALLMGGGSLSELHIEVGLSPEDFYRESHGHIFAAMTALEQRNEKVDSVTVAEHLLQTGLLEQVGGKAGLESLAVAVPAIGHLKQYAKIVKENALLRSLLKAAYEIQQRVYGREGAPRELVDMAERAILEVAQDDRRKDFRWIQDVIHFELDKLVRLSKEGAAITGTPSGYEDLDAMTGGFQPGNLIILAARPSMGKCLAGSSLVYDPTTGARRRIDALVGEIEAGRDAYVACVGSDLKLRSARVSAGLRSGVQPVYRLTTRLGRQVEATATHPLLTVRGWRELRELGPGDRIAVPRRLPCTSTQPALPDHELVLLAALIADGDLAQRTPRIRLRPDSPVRGDIEAAAATMGLRVESSPGSGATATISAGHGGTPDPLTARLEELGLRGRTSRDAFVPDAIFGLAPEQIARFLSVLYACDGHVQASDRPCRDGFTTVSRQLAHDVQHLLLRLGIVASIRALGREVHDGTGTITREVRITSREGLDAFAATVPVAGTDETMADAVASGAPRRSTTTVDTVAGGPHHLDSEGLARPQPVALASAVDSPGWHEIATSDIWWDEVASIEYVGEQETYDLTVPGDHNFVADDVVVHNSALMANFCENAALKHGRAVALFSLEMSESELAQRFIASQASVKGDDLRKGRVQGHRWGKIYEAADRLSQSPLYIDDSSELSVLDVRAKSRRLAQQQPDGLGLIVIDYLQLMRADGIDNRVEAIGAISRGLKTLARELSVPVIALSQLNRGVEQRTDKRPMLSDLRESGAIEQDADLVMMVYRDEYYNEDSEREGIAELIIAKHRNGGLGTVELSFQKEYPRFMSYAGDDL